MIIGGSKKQVIENIKQALLDGDLNRKVEENDPSLTEAEKEGLLERFFAARNKKSFALKQKAVLEITNLQLKSMSKNIKIEGAEVLKDIAPGAIFTANHFNPLDNVVIRKLIKEQYGKELYVVIQDTNLAMDGVIGDLMNYLPNIPISKSAKYIRKTFLPYLKEILGAGNPVLIYPEEEMWFNYRKPRSERRGTFYFAAELNVPVVPCFVEIIDTKEPDNDEFFETKYVLHVLQPILPDPKKSVRQNSIEMAKKDYLAKCDAYEKAYQKKLTYKFEQDDIAGWHGRDK